MAKTKDVQVRQGNVPTPADGKAKAVHQQAGSKQQLTKNLRVRAIDFDPQSNDYSQPGEDTQPGGGATHTPSHQEEHHGKAGGYGVDPASFPATHYAKGTATTRRPNAVKPRVGNQPHTK